MNNPYYAGRIIMDMKVMMNYKQIIGKIINVAMQYNSDYILFNSDNNSANTILSEFNKFKIQAEWASVNGETLVSVPINDSLIRTAKNNGIIC